MTRNLRALLLPALLLLPAFGFAQVISGIVLDRDTELPVEGVLVSIDEGAESVETDAHGEFRFEDTGAGRHVVTFQHLQFEPVYREIQVAKAQNYAMQVAMVKRFVELPEATVTGTRFTREHALYTITPEEITRYPGTFFDPARFALSFPGVQIVNDQANQLVINGMAPDLMKWRIEGLEVVNPNHLANAGTLSDRPTSTGGGVQMLSNLVLENSQLLTGVMPGYGNATSGIMDMYFRNGNTDDYQHSVQVGLLGLEAMTEGPFKKGGKTSYLVNGRYSTVGLLSAVGVDFGDERIQFGDISANVNFNLSDRSSLKVYGLYGANSNKFEAKNFEEWEEDKDRHNIDYSSSTYITGLTFKQAVGKSSAIAARVAYSSTDYDRQDAIVDSAGMMSDFSMDDGAESKLSFDLRYGMEILSRYYLTLGVNGTVNEYDVRVDPAALDEFYFMDISNAIYRPYVSIRGAITERLQGHLGLGVGLYEQAGFSSWEPEIELNYSFSPYQQMTLGYRLSSQSMDSYAFTQAEVEFFPGSPPSLSDNTDLGPLRSHHFYLGYQLVVGKGILDVTARYIHMFNSPVDALQIDFSPLNNNPYPAFRELYSEGAGTNVSLGVGYRKNFENDWFATANVAFISSRFEDRLGASRSTSFDLGYVAYLASGKEWVKEKDKGVRTWGVNGAIIANGGMLEPLIDVDASRSKRRTVYFEDTQSEVQLPDYFRFDARVYWRMDKSKASSTISLDIQNLLGKENAYFSNYDLLYREIREGKQLGLIPVLNWRLDF